MARGKGEVLLAVGDDRYTLVFDMDAIAAFEDATDLSIFEVFGNLAAAQASGKPPKLSVLGSLLQAGLSRNHPGMTRADAMALVVNPAAQEALAVAFELAIPPAQSGETEEGAEARPPKGRRGK